MGCTKLYLDDFLGSRGTRMRGPLTSAYCSTKRLFSTRHVFSTRIIPRTTPPYFLLLQRLMARLSGATPGARVVPSVVCCSQLNEVFLAKSPRHTPVQQDLRHLEGASHSIYTLCDMDSNTIDRETIGRNFYSTKVLLRGTIVNRTYGTYKNLYV